MSIKYAELTPIDFVIFGFLQVCRSLNKNIIRKVRTLKYLQSQTILKDIDMQYGHLKAGDAWQRSTS